MNIAIGADHRGAPAIVSLAESLRQQGHNVQLLGECTGKPCDYPDSAWLVGGAIARGEAEFGVLICGTGIGMCIAANKVPGVRAALVHDELTAEMCRTHNDANVLCISADLTGVRRIEAIVDLFLSTPFGGGRHARRVKKIAMIEQGADPATLAEG